MMKKLIASVAVIALSAAPAVAQGNGKGNGNGNGGGKSNAAAKQNGGGSPAKAQRGNGGGNSAAQRGNGGGNNAAQRVNRSAPAKAQRGNGNANRGSQAVRGNNGNGNGNSTRRITGNGNGNGNGNNGNRVVNIRGNDSRGSDLRVDIRSDQPRISFGGNNFGSFRGCPPGLAKKNNGCTPPGLARKNSRYNDPGFFGYRGVNNGSYFYDDGYLVQLGSSGVSGFIPLFGGALSIGNQWPDYYSPVDVPNYYVDYYNLGQPASYRYADNVVYRLDPESAAITSVAALLTGDEFAVGQPVPSGYGVYNVPYQYRDRYVDRSDAYYRYSDGYVYQVDPETRLVAAAIELVI